MPDKSEYIIIENDNIEIYNNYRGDYTFLSDIFLGVKLTKDFIRRQNKIENIRTGEILSSILLDYDSKVLLIEYYPWENESGSGILGYELFIEMLRIRYPNWRIIPIFEDTNDIWRYVNFDRKLNIEAEDRKIIVENIAEGTFSDEPRGTLISIQENKTTKIFWNKLSLPEIIQKGVSFILEKENQMMIPVNKFPFGGLNLDKEKNELFLWYFLPLYFERAWSKNNWDSLKVNYQWNAYKKHIKMINYDGLDSQILKAKREAIEILRESIVDKYASHSKLSNNDRYLNELSIISTSERNVIFENTLKEI